MEKSNKQYWGRLLIILFVFQVFATSTFFIFDEFNIVSNYLEFITEYSFFVFVCLCVIKLLHNTHHSSRRLRLLSTAFLYILIILIFLQRTYFLLDWTITLMIFAFSTAVDISSIAILSFTLRKKLHLLYRFQKVSFLWKLCLFFIVKFVLYVLIIRMIVANMLLL